MTKKMTDIAYNRRRVLRSFLKLIKHFVIRTDDNRATFVEAQNSRIFSFKRALIQKTVRFAGIVELSNMIHKWFF